MRQGTPLHGDLRHAPRRGDVDARGHQHQRPIRPRRERLQHALLVAQKAIDGPLAGRAVDPHIRDLAQPAHTLIREIGIAQKLPPVEKAAAQVADRSLHFPLGLRAIRTARPNAKAPVRGEAPKLRILQELAPTGSLVLNDDRLQLIKEDLLRHPAEVREGALQTLQDRQRRLPWYELHIQLARIAEDDQHGVALPPGQPDLGEIELRLQSRRCLEADDGLELRTRPHAGHVIPETGYAPDVACRPTLGEQPLGRQRRVRLESLEDQRLERVEALRPWRGRAGHRRLDHPRQLPGRDPVMDRPRANA